MCRLFGFRSAVPSTARRSLARAENALRVQSRAHPHGWGIGWWEGPRNHLVRLERGTGPAHAEAEFDRVAAAVSTTQAIAHVRRASVGPPGLANAHPFRHGRWLFAHNGTVSGWDRARAAIEAEIEPRFLAGVRGETDSERLFALFLTRLSRRRDPADAATAAEVRRALAETVALVASHADPGAAIRSSTTFLVGNGELLAACRRGRTLYVSTHKRACADRASCPRLRRECETSPREGGPVHHLLVASEVVSPDDVWEEVPEDGMISIDGELRVERGSLIAGR
jgi:predicted glutamine amidotransferase